MIIRSARESDIPKILEVQYSESEYRYVNPPVFTEELCRSYILHEGKGWVCYDGDDLVGFGIIDLASHKLWALYISLEADKEGHGEALHNLLLEWFFATKSEAITLIIEDKTRAASFYRSQGWLNIGPSDSSTVILELTKENWNNRLFKEIE